MADIELVVKIPEEVYIHFLSRYKYQDTNDLGLSEFDKVGVATKKGIPLPKGHGRLGDLDAVMSDITKDIEAMTNIGIAVDGEYLWAKLNDAIDNAPTVIEADKAESEEE